MPARLLTRSIPAIRRDRTRQEEAFRPRRLPPSTRVGQPASRRPGSLPAWLGSRRRMGGWSILGSRIWSAKATAPDPVGVNGRRGSRSPAKSPSSGGSSFRNSQGVTCRRCGGMSFRTDLNKSTRTATGMPKTTTPTAAVPTRQFCHSSFVDSIGIPSHGRHRPSLRIGAGSARRCLEPAIESAGGTTGSVGGSSSVGLARRSLGGNGSCCCETIGPRKVVVSRS